MLRSPKKKKKKKKKEKKVHSLTTKDYSFSLGRMYFTSNDDSQNTFFLSTNTWCFRIKEKTMLLIMFLVVDQKDLKSLCTAFLHSIKLSEDRIGNLIWRSFNCIAFDSPGFRRFDNDSVRNVIIFGVDNSSSSHAENRKK